MALLPCFWLLLYSASCKQSGKYYNDGDDKQNPYDSAKVEDEKAQKPQYDKNHSNYEKKIKCSHFQKPSLTLNLTALF